MMKHSPAFVPSWYSFAISDFFYKVGEKVCELAGASSDKKYAARFLYLELSHLLVW